MKNKIIWIFLIVLIAIKSFLWLYTIPIFQSPDEAVHFGYAQRIAELGGRGDPRFDGIISKELLEAAKIINFNWGETHPVWKGYPQEWKEKLVRIDLKWRRDFFAESAQITDGRGRKNPPFYYYLASSFYLIVKSDDFLIRFYVVRIFSVVLSLFTVFFSYKIGKILLRKEFPALALACLVVFQPMFSFLSGAINNDNLLILLATMFLYFGLKAIQEKNVWYKIIALVCVALGLLTKPQAVTLLLAFPFVFKRKSFKVTLVFFLASILILFSAFSLGIGNNTLPVGSILESMLPLKSIATGEFWQGWVSYFQANRETYLNNLFPWYWGVFGWLEKTMPLMVYRIIKVILTISIVGLVVWLAKNFKRKKQLQMVIFLVGSLIFFYSGIILNDFKVFFTTSTSFGLQGRYFIPMISAQMVLIYLGLQALTPKKFENLLAGLLICAGIILNGVGFMVMRGYFWG